jgi:glutathione S-transferase
MELYIGNKNYSSWSLRAWLLMRQAGIAFNERQLRFDHSEGSPFSTTLLALAPTARVPLLVDEGFAVWDSLAIAEYLAERFPEKRLWPLDPRQRARARSLCAEMHSGFPALRSRCPMNVEASLPEVGTRLVAEWPAVVAELRRIDAMWREALAESGGPFLFGAFGIVDAYFAPVCVRAQTYRLPLGAEAGGYAARILALPAMQEWSTAARAEHDFVEEDEPYRQRP